MPDLHILPGIWTPIKGYDRLVARLRDLGYRDTTTDPDVPPLPPHIRAEQARALAAALRKGDPETRSVLVQSFKEKIIEFLPGR